MYRCKNITDNDIQALIDDELDREETAYVRTAIESNHQLLNRYNELLRQKKLIKRWFEEKESVTKQI